MPGWQEFYDKHKHENFEILSVSVDIQGADVVKPYVKGTTFTTVVDTENRLANYFGFKIVPNGIFVDSNGTIRLLKQGFSVANEEHVQAVKSLLKSDVDKVKFKDAYYSPCNPSSVLENQLAQTKFKLGMEYLNLGKKEEALKELDEALSLDPENFLFRKQRWYIRYPEKFSPIIDMEWQQQQLEKERNDEVAECGPEGCVIPGTNQNNKGVLNNGFKNRNDS